MCRKRNNITGVAILLCLLHTYVMCAQEKTWWKETVFYQIYMPSYADSNGDGYGDFKGITSKLDYIKELGVKGIWLTPFLKSPKVDNGYDVADYYAVDPVYGTNNDFKVFLNEAHSRGIKVIMDMVVNHTSTECTWFKEAAKSKNSPYRDYYIWKDAPNNWESFFGGTAWKKNAESGQYYYHKFDVTMADLNWQNPKVVQEVENVLRFWLDMGVDGFRFDVIIFLTTSGITKDNTVKDGVQEHMYDISQPGVKNAIKQLKKVVSSYPGRFTVGEIGSDKLDLLKQYQASDMMDVVFNFNFGSMATFSVQKICDELQGMEHQMNGYPTLFFGSHDMPRMRERLADGNTDKALALAALTLTARGVPFVYYGDELGMRNITADSFSEIVDIQAKTHYNIAMSQGKSEAEALVIANQHNRDKSRSPMQWDAGEYAGFSAGKPWIKVNADFKNNNAAVLSADKESILNSYKKLVTLRNTERALQYGLCTNLSCSENRISFTRVLNAEKVTVVINFGTPYYCSVPKKARILYGERQLKAYDVLIYKVF